MNETELTFISILISRSKHGSPKHLSHSTDTTLKNLFLRNDIANAKLIPVATSGPSRRSDTYVNPYANGRSTEIRIEKIGWQFVPQSPSCRILELSELCSRLRGRRGHEQWCKSMEGWRREDRGSEHVPDAIDESEALPSLALILPPQCSTLLVSSFCIPASIFHLYPLFVSYFKSCHLPSALLKILEHSWKY